MVERRKLPTDPVSQILLIARCQTQLLPPDCLPDARYLFMIYLKGQVGTTDFFQVLKNWLKKARTEFPTTERMLPILRWANLLHKYTGR